MATPHLNHLQDLVTLKNTQITSVSFSLSINGVPVDVWLNQALVPYIRPALPGFLQSIFDSEKILAGPEIDALIAQDQQTLAQHQALKAQLGV